MLLKRKIMLGAVILAALPVLSSSLAIQNLTASKSQAALEQAAKERLTAVRDLTRERIEDYFGLIRHQVITYSEDLMIIDAMRHFKAGFDSYREELEPEIPALRSQLKSYYTSDFATEYARRNPGEQAPTDRWLSQLDSDSIALQYQYIKASPHPLGEKHKLDDPSDGSSYAKHHKKYHPVIRGFLEKFNYYDIFLVDPDSGDIVYSVYKEVDFTTTLKTGLYAGTKIGEVFKRANQAVSADFIAISSFSPYSPSYEDPAGFIASPIFDGKRKIGILIFQMPISHINKVMTNNRNWKQVGLGDSGETYLIAADTLMLSNSRFLLDDKAGYLQAIRDAGVAEKTVNSIASKNTSIGFHPVETQGSKAALAGETGFATFPDYRNVEVLSAYAPLTIEGKNWAIMAEIDKAEAFAAADELSQQLLTLSAAIAGVLLILALGTGIWFSGLFTRPILALSRTIETIDRNADLTQQIEINSNDEIGLAATAFNNLTTKIRSSLQQVNDASAHLATTAEETSVITQQTSQVVQGQLMETTQVATAMNEMSATVQEVANNTTNSSQAAREANESATSGQQAMQQTITQIDELAANIAGASDVIQRVEKNSEEINTVLDVIKSIAEQTNLLALNAAIEAARAGEQGRGFAVVADEVRTLANRTQESTEEINKIIEKLQSGSHQAVECMEMSREMAVSAVEQASNTGATLSTIVQAIGQINDMSTQIANAAEEQSAVAGEINRNVVQINDMTEQTAAGAQQTAAASGDQARLASQLKILVSQFKV